MFKPIGDFVEYKGPRPDDDYIAFNEGMANVVANNPGVETEACGNVMILKSLCVNCEEQGTTRLMLTKIPFFREIILMAFTCEECGYRSTEVQSAEAQSKGCRFECKLESTRDLSRQVVKGEKATVSIPELDFEIPAITQCGVFTTVEGILDRAIEQLEESQVYRRPLDPQGAEAVDAFLVKLKDHREGRAFPFTIILDDPTGNSFLENPNAPKSDPRMKVRYYVRTQEQNEALGFFSGNAGEGAAAGLDANENALEAIPEDVVEDEDGDVSALKGSQAQATYRNTEFDTKAAIEAYHARLAARRAAMRGRAPDGTIDTSGNVPSGFRKGGALIDNPTTRAALTEASKTGVIHDESGGVAALFFESSSTDNAKELMRFRVNCHECISMGDCLMCVTDIPHFKEVILMGFTCDDCGYKSVEIKGGGAVPEHGTITTLKFTPGTEWSEDDLGRDIIKSDTTALEIPELDLELDAGSLGGMYTTIEGLFVRMAEKLSAADPFAHGVDSTEASRKERMEHFLEKLRECSRGERPFTLILRDPMANTWIYSPFAGTGVDDPRLIHETYERSHDENLYLGLLDMNAPRTEEDESAGDKESIKEEATSSDATNAEAESSAASS